MSDPAVQAPPADQPSLIATPEPKPFFTSITVDGRPLRFFAECGTILIAPRSRGADADRPLPGRGPRPGADRRDRAGLPLREGAGPMILDPVSAGALPLRRAPAPSVRRCGDCPSLMRPDRSLYAGGDARCAETLHHRIVAANWQPKDEAPFWCPRERRS